jgi:acetyl esterase/lipase
MIMSQTPGHGGRRPDIQRVYEHLERLFVPKQAPDPTLDPIAAVRQVISECVNFGPEPTLDGVTVTPVSADGVPAEWIVAKGGSSRHRIVFLHGGGWVGGTLKMYRAMAAETARLSQASVLVVDYRLVPENPFPAGLDDCYRALAWAASHGPDETANRGATAEALSISLMGDSAGSNLAAAACARAIEKAERVPERLVLIGPALDAVPNPERVGRDDFMVTPASIDGAFALYSGGTVSLTDPRLSPMHTPEHILERFPPTLIQVSGAEGWIFDARHFTQRLEEVRVRVLLSIWPGLPHVWHVFLTSLPESRQALQEIADFIRPAPRT